MKFFEIAKKAGRGLAMTATILAAVSLTAAPGTAYARDWHHGGGGNWHHHHGGPGPGLVLGLLAGGVAGAAIACRVTAMAGRWAVLCAVAVIGLPPRGICRSLHEPT